MNNFVGKCVYARGSEIYNAFVRGSRRHYNRSVSDYSVYEKLLHDLYIYLLKKTPSREVRRRINKFTNYSWKNAFLPLFGTIYEDHVNGKFVRVMIQANKNSYIDIPYDDWEMFEAVQPSVQLNRD